MYAALELQRYVWGDGAKASTAKAKKRSSRPLMFNFRPQKVTTLAGRSLSYFPTRKRKGEVVIIYTRMVYAKIFHGGKVLLSGGGGISPHPLSTRVLYVRYRAAKRISYGEE